MLLTLRLGKTQQTNVSLQANPGPQLDNISEPSVFYSFALNALYFERVTYVNILSQW